MEACLLIALWMGKELQTPAVKCFADEAARLAYVRLVNAGFTGDNYWLSMFCTRTEIIESGREVIVWEDRS